MTARASQFIIHLSAFIISFAAALRFWFLLCIGFKRVKGVEPS